jgi:hypothetical protein
VLADVAEFSEGDVLPVAVSDPLQVQALALRNGSRVRLVLANMRDGDAIVTIHVAGLREVTQRALDAATVFSAASDAGAFRESGTPIAASGALRVTLPPFGLVTMDGNLTRE